MIRSFRNQGTEDLFNGIDSKAARKVCAEAAVKAARRKLVALEAATKLEELRGKGYGLEKLERDRAGQHAIRIDDQFRVCFIWTEGAAEQVEVTDYH
jgi:proteic killer suppression protein